MSVNIQELEEKLTTAQNDDKIELLHSLSRAYSTSSPEKSLDFAKEAALLSEKNGDKTSQIKSFMNVGKIYVNLCNFDDALNIYHKTLNICEEESDKPHLALAFNQIGNVYWYIGNYEKALENYMNALKIREEIGEDKGIYSSYNNIGMIHWAMKNHDKALKYYHKSLEKAENIGEKETADPINNIGIVHSVLKNHKKALKYYLKALKIYQKYDNKKYTANSLMNIADTYEKLNLPDKALEYYQKSHQLKEEIKDKWGIAYTSNALANIYIKFEDLDQAKFYLEKSSVLATEINANALIRDNYLIFSKFYEDNGDYQNALEYHKLYTKKKDEIINAKSREKLTRLENRYEIESKEKDLIALKHKFINITSHELRTPLTVLSGYLYLLKKKVMRNHACQCLQTELAIFDETLKRLNGIVNNIYNLFQIHTIKNLFEMNAFSLSELVRNVEREITPFIQKRNQTLEVILPDEEVTINANRDLVWQILMNLALNAIRYTPDEGKIAIEICKNSDDVHIKISDTGIGIPESEQEKIFEQFYEIEDVLKHKTGDIGFRAGGLGLGLSIAKSAVNYHSGKIWVESEAGKGSRFTVVLPK
jgi:signal transduction histidine kinase/Tfp pilus assembly protein PilF